MLSDKQLEASSVVANNTMNRERGLTGVNSYARELGFAAITHLSVCSTSPSWLDLCCGEGRALSEAANRLPATAVLTGIDLVGPLSSSPATPGVELITASVADWTATRPRRVPSDRSQFVPPAGGRVSRNCGRAPYPLARSLHEAGEPAKINSTPSC